MNSRPVEIIGGGLAGLSLGLALRREKVPVVLHEAGDYPRHRVCGEFIAGLDRTTRDRLGLDPLLSGALPHREVAWFKAGPSICRHALPSPALGISRHTLDRRLAEAFVAAGGELRARSRVDTRTAPHGRVFAHGRRARPDSPWIGLKIHARSLALDAPLEVHLGDRAYVGLCAVDGGRVNICGLFHRQPGLIFDRAHALLAHLRAAGLDALARRVEDAEPDFDSHSAVSGLVFGRAPLPPNFSSRLVLGDAHALIPPFTGNGMTMAFQSAALALDPLVEWSRGEADWAETRAHIRKKLRSRFRLRLAASALLHPFFLRGPAQTGLAAAIRSRLVPISPLYHALH